VITWDGHPDSYLEDDIYLKRYHWSHAPLGQQYLVNSYQAGAQSNPCVGMNGDGEFVVVWQSAGQGTEKDIFGQRFGDQGEHTGEPILIGDQFRINTYVPEDQRYAAVAMSGTGTFVAVWESYRQDGSGYGVFGETGPKAGSGDLTDDGFVDFKDYCVVAEEWGSENSALKGDLIDDNRIDGQDLGAFCGQWLTPCRACSEVDINNDGKIDFRDYAKWAGNWLRQGPDLDGDVTGDGIVDGTDLKRLVFHWLRMCE
jgi:hypothetical protein